MQDNFAFSATLTIMRQVLTI